MSVTVTEVSSFERRLTLRFGRLPLDRAETRAARRISRDIHINGFRRGRAPRRMVQNIVGRGRIRREALEELLGTRLPDALRDAELAPAVSPSVDDVREVEGGLEVDVLVSLWPTLERVPDYVGRRFEVSTDPLVFGEERVEDEMRGIREEFAELKTVERPSAPGDHMEIDLSVTHRGQPVQSASVSDFSHEVGSDDLLEGLGDELLGRSVGDIFEFGSALRFEADGLEAGTPVDARVLVKDVREIRLPELDDEWVSDSTEFETVEELRKAVRSDMEAERRHVLRRNFPYRIIEELLAEIEVDLPQAVIDAEVAARFEEFQGKLDGAGVSFDEFLRRSDLDRDAYFKYLARQADRKLRTNVLLDSVAISAGLKVDDFELAAAYDEAAAYSDETGPELAKRLAGSLQELALVSSILRTKAVSVLTEGAVAEDRYGNVLDLRIDPADGVDHDEEIVEAEIVDVEYERGEP